MVEQRREQIKRRKYFIDRKFQTGFMLKFVGVLLFGAVLSIAITLMTTQATLTSSFEGSKLVIEKTSLAILPSVVFTNVITTLVVGAVALVITLLVSHKIAGPMYRFEKDLKEIAEGNLRKRIHTRNGDQFESVAAGLNDMVVKLNEKLSEVKGELDLLAESADAHNLPQDFRNALEACRSKIDEKFTL